MKVIENALRIEARYRELEENLARPENLNNPEAIKRLSQEISRIEEVVNTYREYVKIQESLRADRQDLKETTDTELKHLLSNDIARQEQALAALEGKIRVLLVPKDPRDERDVFLEVRAGAGGDEAAIFSSDLLRMYLRFAERMKWESIIVSKSESETGGIKEAIVEIKGKKVFSHLRFESGVHRVQRIPVTESSGRLHTSTATVAVLPMAEEVEVDIKPQDLKIDTFRSSSAGGQHVNKTSSAVRITHLPSGLVVTCQDERSQLQNKAKALRMLSAYLLNIAEEERRSRISQDRRNQVGTGDRSERIRTYNFPQTRITDHRLSRNFYNIDEVLDGNLSEIIESLRADYVASLLSET